MTDTTVPMDSYYDNISNGGYAPRKLEQSVGGMTADQCFPMRCFLEGKQTNQSDTSSLDNLSNPFDSPNGFGTSTSSAASPNPFDDNVSKNTSSYVQPRIQYNYGDDPEYAGSVDYDAMPVRQEHYPMSKPVQQEFRPDVGVMDDFLSAFEAEQKPHKRTPVAEEPVNNQRRYNDYDEGEHAVHTRKRSMSEPVRKQNNESSASKYELKDNRIYYEIKQTGIAGNVRKLTVTDNNNKEIYKIMISLDPQVIHVEDHNNTTLLTIKQKLLSIHPEFIIKLKGIKYARCTQRFKIGSKKFNYKKSDGHLLKMIGEYGHHFGIFNAMDREFMLAKIWDQKEKGYKLELDAGKSDELHIIGLVCIMSLQRYLGVMGNKSMDKKK
jgi:uncharacterized protein YxjI